MAERKLTIDGEDWGVVIGKKNVKYRPPNGGKTFIVDKHVICGIPLMEVIKSDYDEVLGWWWSDKHNDEIVYSDYVHKETGEKISHMDFSVTPAKLLAYLQNNGHLS